MTQEVNALALVNVSFSFSPGQKLFFENLSLSFSAGGLHFIKGQNGTGKSTLLRLLQADIHKSEVVNGELVVHDVSRTLFPGQKHHQAIGLVPQTFDKMIAPAFSFKKNCSFALFAEYPGCAQLPVIQAVPKFVERFRIDTSIPVEQLSGGQRQILAITMMLQKKADILLLDEPTATLDEGNANLVMQFLYDLTRDEKLTIILVSHDRTLLERYAEQGYYELVVNHATGRRSVERRAL